MKQIKIYFLVLSLVLTAAGCKKKETEPPRQPEAEVQQKQIKPAESRQEIPADQQVLKSEESPREPSADTQMQLNSQLNSAALAGDIEQVRSLISKGADPNAKDQYGRTPLHLALNEDVAKVLIDSGSDVNAKDELDYTPLYVAMATGRKALADILIARGVPVSTLHVAVFVGDLSKIKSFIKSPVDLNDKDRDGCTPLHFANSKDVAEFLIAGGADVNAMNNSASTPLHYAAWRGDTDVVEMLLARGVDVNAKNRFGLTPLHRATAAGLSDVAVLLIAEGADVNARDKNGRTVLQWARKKGHNEIVELLRKHGAKE